MGESVKIVLGIGQNGKSRLPVDKRSFLQYIKKGKINVCIFDNFLHRLTPMSNEIFVNMLINH
jgi:hypothetical protein